MVDHVDQDYSTPAALGNEQSVDTVLVGYGNNHPSRNNGLLRAASSDDVVKRISHEPSWKARQTRGLFLKKHSLKKLDEEEAPKKPKTWGQAVEDYFKSFLPPHVRRRGLQAPPIKVREEEISWEVVGCLMVCDI